jgi:hypothetical protein
MSYQNQITEQVQSATQYNMETISVYFPYLTGYNTLSYTELINKVMSIAQNIGLISRIDLVHKNEDIFTAFVHFTNWFNMEYNIQLHKDLQSGISSKLYSMDNKFVHILKCTNPIKETILNIHQLGANSELHEEKLLEHEKLLHENTEELADLDDKLLEHSRELESHEEYLIEQENLIYDIEDNLKLHKKDIDEYEKYLIEQENWLYEHEDYLIEQENWLYEHEGTLEEQQDEINSLVRKQHTQKLIANTHEKSITFQGSVIHKQEKKIEQLEDTIKLLLERVNKLEFKNALPLPIPILKHYNNTNNNSDNTISNMSESDIICENFEAQDNGYRIKNYKKKPVMINTGHKQTSETIPTTSTNIVVENNGWENITNMDYISDDDSTHSSMPDLISDDDSTRSSDIRNNDIQNDDLHNRICSALTELRD